MFLRPDSMLRVMPVLLLSFGRRNFVRRNLFRRRLGTRLKHEKRVGSRRRGEGKARVVKEGRRVGKRGKGQSERGSVRIERSTGVGLGIVSKYGIWASALNAWALGLNTFCQIAWHYQTVLVKISTTLALDDAHDCLSIDATDAPSFSS